MSPNLVEIQPEIEPTSLDDIIQEMEKFFENDADSLENLDYIRHELNKMDIPIGELKGLVNRLEPYLDNIQRLEQTMHKMLEGKFFKKKF